MAGLAIKQTAGRVLRFSWSGSKAKVLPIRADTDWSATTPIRLSTSGDRVWLVELISLFANAENKLVEVMLLDLIQGPFRQVPFSLHRTDPKTGRRDTVRMTSHLVKAAQVSS